MINPKLPSIYYGGDYNPDQWPEEIWEEDMRLFKLAGVNVVTLPVFSWAKLQPDEDTYDFGWLDRVLDMLVKNGIFACLATPTAAQPFWMSLKYPEILPVDSMGRKRQPGSRINFCPNSTMYRKFARELARRLAERYKDHPALLLWHINNEYGNNEFGHYCYCENCAATFRSWLKNKYGTLEELNRCWYTGFWSHDLYDWDEIMPPSELNGELRCSPGISADYNRFMSDSSLACYLEEYGAIKAVTPDIAVTTNMMFGFKPFDYFKWAEYADVISWDNYPTLTGRIGERAMWHDLMRGLKGGKPFMLMEQAPSQVCSHPYNSLKRPGAMRLWSYQAVARGSDTVMFFQMRAGRGALEKYHSALISHAGHENTRNFRECAQLGMELESIGDILLDSTVDSNVAILFDWENWWVSEFSTRPSIDLNYLEQVQKYYNALYESNIPVDFTKPNADLAKYKLVIAPMLYMMRHETALNLERYVKGGGNLVTTCFSGMADESDLVVMGGYPGHLRKLLGIWVEEIDGLYPGMKNRIVMYGSDEKEYRTYECSVVCDVINPDGARTLAVFGDDFYAGKPVVTENAFGSGKAYYIGTVPDDLFVREFLGMLCDRNVIHAPMNVPKGVEVTRRVKNGKEFTFVLNHNAFEVKVDTGSRKFTDLITKEEIKGELPLGARGVAILYGE